MSPKVILKRRQHIYHIESKVYDFYKHHPGVFFGMVACNLLAHVSSVMEVYVTLRMLGFSPQLAQAYIIESLTKVINFVFAFVPGTIGVYEGGTEVVLQTLGFAAATGVALALVRKAGDSILDHHRPFDFDLAHAAQRVGVVFWIAVHA